MNTHPPDPSRPNTCPSPTNELYEMLVAPLDNETPHGFLLMTSALIDMMRNGSVDQQRFLDGLLAIDERGSNALLIGLAHLLPDDAARSHAQSLVANLKTHQKKLLPTWLRRLHRTRPVTAVVSTEATGDSTYYFIELQVADKHTATVVVLVDAVADCVADITLADFPVAQVKEHLVGEGDAWKEVRANNAATEVRQKFVDSINTVTTHVPLMIWAARLADDGTASLPVPSPKLPPADLHGLVAEFLEGDFGLLALHNGLDDLVEPFVVLAETTGHGRVERWGPARAERFVGEIAASALPEEFLDGAMDFPDLVAWWVIFVHRKFHIQPHVTLRTLRAISMASFDFVDALFDRQDELDCSEIA